MIQGRSNFTKLTWKVLAICLLATTAAASLLIDTANAQEPAAVRIRGPGDAP